MNDDENTCYACGQVLSGVSLLRPFYVTCYQNGSERVRYHAMYCDGCADMAIHEYELAVWNGKNSA